MLQEVEIIVDSKRSGDCFGVLSDNFLDKLCGGTAPAGVLVLQVRCQPEPSSPLSPGAPASSRPPSTVYVGCLRAQQAVQSGVIAPGATTLKNGQLSLAPQFASDLGMVHGSVANVSVTRQCSAACTVLVAPATVDDSEVVELNALMIEATLLRFLRVVFPGQVVTVTVHKGLTAKIVVQSVKLSNDSNVACARLDEGTELHVAVRPRVAPQSTGVTRQPQCGVLRLTAWAATGSLVDDVRAASAVLVSSRTASALSWTEKETQLGLFHCADLVAADNEDISAPSNIRAKACVAPLRIASADDSTTYGLMDGVVYLPDDGSSALKEARGNVLAMPRPPENVVVSLSEFLARLQALPGCPPASFRKNIADLVAVHGSVPKQLEKLLCGGPPTAVGCRGAPPLNVMLCGPSGSGKSTVAVSAALASPRTFVRYVPCSDSKTFLADVERAMTTCIVNAPSVLILDAFDRVAPAQAEGNVAAISDATFAALENVIHIRLAHGLTTLFGVAPVMWQKSASSVCCLALATHRDNVFDGLRSGRCFGSILSIAPLQDDSRITMTMQELRGTALFTFLENMDGGAASLRKVLARRTANFSPFDVKVFARRLRHCVDHTVQVNDDLGKHYSACIEDVAGKYQSLAQQGVPMIRHAATLPSWGDIGGLSDVKKVLYDTIILPLKMPKLFSKLPLKARSGVLLFGPSGCGKTFVIQTVAAAEKLNCIVVNGPEIFGKYIGQSEQKVREVFERAQAAAPSVVFFDEFDSVAPQRGNDNTGVTDRVVNQLLCYLDGVEARKDVIVVAASSRPDLIDAALLRPGRLDKALYCPPPTATDREEILVAHLKKTHHTVSDSDVRALVAPLEGWTSADIAAVVATANMNVQQRTVDMSRERAKLNIGAGNDDAVLLQQSISNGFDIVVPQKNDAKVAERMQTLVEEYCKATASSSNGTDATVETRARLEVPTITTDDVAFAISNTRRSTSDVDLAKQQLLFNRFIQSRQPGSHPKAAQAGSRVTMA